MRSARHPRAEQFLRLGQGPCAEQLRGAAEQQPPEESLEAEDTRRDEQSRAGQGSSEESRAARGRAEENGPNEQCSAS